MRYKIKLKPQIVALCMMVHFICLLGAFLLGNSMPQDPHSSDPVSVAFGCFIVFIGTAGVIATLRYISFDELKVTDISKELEDEINQRVKIKVNAIIDKLNDK